MEIKFNCTNPSCAQHICIDASWCGREVQCPVCSTRLQVPTPADSSAAVPGAGRKRLERKYILLLMLPIVCLIVFASAKIYLSIRKQREMVQSLTPTDAYRAVQKRDLARVIWLLDHRPDFLTRPVTPRRSTMLHVAVSAGSAPIVEELLRRKANVNARDAFGATPLHGCTDPAIARMLLDQGADAAIQTREGFTVLQTATNRHRGLIIQVLREHGVKE